MAGRSPLIDYPGGGSVVEWTKTLDAAMAKLDFDTVIPGHGAVTDKAGLKTYRDNVEKLRTARQRPDPRRQDAGRCRQSDDRRVRLAARQSPDAVEPPGLMRELK